MHKARERERERGSQKKWKKEEEKEPGWYIKLNHWYCST
jgi:hypothetical protein